VETRNEYLEALSKRPPTLILSDYSLPGFNGHDALSLALEKCPQTPFIFVTGTMGEEVAIETLKSGATDYVLKTRLSSSGQTLADFVGPCISSAAKNHWIVKR
jgi:CheY-like chemotaxis protein